MKKSILFVSLLLASFVAAPAIAADKVVVVPLNSSRTPAAALPIAYGNVYGASAPYFWLLDESSGIE